MNSKPEGTEEKITDAFLPARIVKFRDNAWGEGWWHVYVTLPATREHPRSRQLHIADIEGKQRGQWVAHPKAYRHPRLDQYEYPTGDRRIVAAENVVFDFVEWQNVRSEDTAIQQDAAELRRQQEVIMDNLRAKHAASDHG
jgi:hypothetical protein